MAAGLVGRDALGERILADCREHQIDAKYLRPIAEAPTSYTDVMTEVNGGRRTFFHMRGANALWSGADIAFTRLKARIFHLGYLLLLDELDKPDKNHGPRPRPSWPGPRPPASKPASTSSARTATGSPGL